jgi:hypothetical protein
MNGFHVSIAAGLSRKEKNNQAFRFPSFLSFTVKRDALAALVIS